MADSPTRAGRRSDSRRRSRMWIAIGAAVAVVAVVVVVALLAGGGGSDSASRGSTTTTGADKTNVTLQAGNVSADSAGAPVSVSSDLAQKVIGTIGDYLQVATVKPLRSGAPAGDLSGVFAGPALDRASGADRAAVVDDGIPKVTGDLDVVAQPVAITGLGDQDGNLVALTATLAVDVKSQPKGKEIPLHINRSGYFVLTPDSSGTWKVTAYKIAVAREGGGVDAPTTTAATTETTR